jgi:hypothetical protein
MSNIRSTPIKGTRATASAGCVALAGILMLLVSVRPLIILLNGGYSILGMAWLAERIGPYGHLCWAVATIWTVNVPMAQSVGLPLTQPLLPSLMVGGISCPEVALILYRLRYADPGLLVRSAGYAMAIFDHTTTAAGLVSSHPWRPISARSGRSWHSSPSWWPCR